MWSAMHGLAFAFFLAPAALLACALAWLLVRPVDRWRVRKLHGPSAVPLLGNLPSIAATPGGIADWFRAMEKKHGKVFKFWPGTRPGVMISDPDAVRKVLLASSNRAPPRQTSLPFTGEAWEFRVVRKAFEEAYLSSESLRAQAPTVEDCIGRLVTQLEVHAKTGEPVDVTCAFSSMAICVIVFIAFGVDLNSLEAMDASKAGVPPPPSDWMSKPGSREFATGLFDASGALVKGTEVAEACMILGRLIPELYSPLDYLTRLIKGTKERNAASELVVAARALIQEWKKHKAAVDAGDTCVPPLATSKHGLLVSLLENHSTELTEMDIIAQAVTTVLAGYEPTAVTISNVFHCLTENPEYQVRLQEEVDAVLQGKTPTPDDLGRLPYVKAVIQEAMRLWNPAYVGSRYLTKDLPLGDGTIIPAKVPLWLSTRNLMLDSSVWPRAEEFLPERWLPGHEHLGPTRKDVYMPFGYGARICPGYKLAQMEARLTVARLMQRFTFARAEGMPEPTWVSGVLLVPRGVWLTLQARSKLGAGRPEP